MVLKSTVCTCRTCAGLCSLDGCTFWTIIKCINNWSGLKSLIPQPKTGHTWALTRHLSTQHLTTPGDLNGRARHVTYILNMVQNLSIHSERDNFDAHSDTIIFMHFNVAYESNPQMHFNDAQTPPPYSSSDRSLANVAKFVQISILFWIMSYSMSRFLKIAITYIWYKLRVAYTFLSIPC